jgi:hypothetical protein
MSNDENTESTKYIGQALTPEIIYSSDSWRKPYLRGVAPLKDGSQGWSVFLESGKILTKAMRIVCPTELEDKNVRKLAVLGFTDAMKLAMDFNIAQVHLATKGAKNDIDSTVTMLTNAGYGEVTQKPQGNKVFAYYLTEFLADFGMFIPVFAKIAEDLPRICPEAKLNCAFDDEDGFPPQCNLVISIPTSVPDFARCFGAVSMFLGITLNPLQEAIEFANYTGTFSFSAKVGSCN